MSCYPLLPSLEVDMSRRIAGVIENVGESGFGLNVLARDIRPGMQLLLAVATGDDLEFVDVNVLHCSANGNNATRLHTSIAGPLKKLFSDDFVLRSSMPNGTSTFCHSPSRCFVRSARLARPNVLLPMWSWRVPIACRFRRCAGLQRVSVP